MTETAPSRLGSKGLILALAGVAVVVLGLFIWKGRQKESAREQLVTEYGALLEQDSDDGGWRVTVQLDAAHQDLTDLSPLLKMAGPISVLDLTGSAELRTFAGIEALDSLKGLIAMSCPKLADVSAVAVLSSLRELVLADATALANPDPIKNLPALETLDLSGTQVAKILIVGLPRLDSLFVSNVPSLKLIDLTGAESLKQLFLDGCRGLEEIRGLGQNVELTDLNVSSCHGLKHLDGLASLGNLQALDLRNALEIGNFEEIGKLKSLTVLRLGGQGQVRDLTLFTGLTGLSELHLEGCENLSSLDGIPPSLSSYAGFTFCPSLTSLKGIEAAPELLRLDLGGCKALADISALAAAKQLTELNLGGCSAVTDLSVLAGLDNLSIVQLGGSGVTPASIEPLKKEKPEVIFDFSGG